METKVCTKCNTEKSIEEYYQIKKSGYTYNYCKKCHYSKMTKATSKRWRKANPKRWIEDVSKAQKAMWGRQREGVYLLLTTKGLYVGQTDKYESRLNQHRFSNFKGNMKYKGAKILYTTLLEQVKDKDQRLEREKYWIQKLKPALNKQFNPDWIKEKKVGCKYIKK